MMSTEERVARLEGRAEETSDMLTDMRQMIVEFEQRIDRRFDHVEARFQGLDGRFQRLEARFQGLEARFQSIDARFLALEAKVDRIPELMTGQFRWTMGLLFTSQLTVIAAVVAAIVAK